MGNKLFDLFKGGSKKAHAATQAALRNIAGYINQINNNRAIYPSDDIKEYSERYATTDDVFSIIKKIATHSARIPVYAYMVKDDEAAKKLKKIRQKHLSPKSLQTKALEDLPDNDVVEMLMEFPCEHMSKFEFYYAIHTFLLSAGESFIYKERPLVGVNKGRAVSLKVLFPQCMIPKVSDTLPRKVMYWDYVVDGHKVMENIPADDIIHIKYFNPQMDYMGSEIRGLSPLKVLLKRLERLDSNMNVSVAQMQNGGVNTIVFEKSPYDQAAVEIVGQRKDNFYRFRKDEKNAGSPFFASGEMGAIQLGLSLADLSVLELAKVDFKKLCNVYGVSDRIFNNDATGSEVSDDNARKGLYTDACIPNVQLVVDALKLNLLNEFEKGRTYTEITETGDQQIVTVKGDNKKRELLADVSEIPELQEDYKALAETFAAMPVIIPNEVLRAFKYEVSPDPLMDKPYIKSGYLSMDDMQPIEPITDPLNNGG